MNRSFLLFISFVLLQLVSLVAGDRYCPQNLCYNQRCNSNEDCYYDNYDDRCYCRRDGLTGGGIAGVVIASIVGVCICVACAMAFNRRRQMQASYATGMQTTQYGAPVGAMYAVPAGPYSPGQQGQYGYNQQPMNAIPVAYAHAQPGQAPPTYGGTAMEGQTQQPYQQQPYYTGNPQETRAI